MADWDEDSPRLQRNLKTLLLSARKQTTRREPITLDQIKAWHREMLFGLTSPNPEWVGTFRGEPGLETIEVKIGNHAGVSAGEVATTLAKFETSLSSILNTLDASIPVNDPLNQDQLSAVLKTCAWAHAEWVRIHPFANGNGRTARLLANIIAMRYGLPPFVRARPRPSGDYGRVSEAAMTGDWHPTWKVFTVLLPDFLSDE